MCRNDSIIVTTIKIGGDTFDDVGHLAVEPNTYLVIYGSGWESPTMKTGANSGHNSGSSFEKLASARNKINKKKHPNDNCIAIYCPTEFDFFESLNTYTNIERLDVYCHGWIQGLNLGGFVGTRMIGNTEMNSQDIDWDTNVDDLGRDFRRVDINEINNQLKTENFTDSTEVYFWGCNIGGQLDPKGKHIAQNANPEYNISLTEDLTLTFADVFAKKIGKGTIYALVGKGTAAGSMFKTNASGTPFFDDGEMLPANVALSYIHKGLSTKDLDAAKHMKKFPVKNN